MSLRKPLAYEGSARKIPAGHKTPNMAMAALLHAALVPALNNDLLTPEWSPFPWNCRDVAAARMLPWGTHSP